jgi:hypothetical protein
VAQIHAIAKPGYTDAKRPLVRKAIDAFFGVDDLKSLALIIYEVLSPQKADENYDNGFEAAIWACVRKLAAIPTPNASSALRALQPVIGRDGAAALETREAIDRQQK